MNVSDITFCIKTINRPWACKRLVESLIRTMADPKIVVVDDGAPEWRFSRKYPSAAAKCTVIDLPDFDVGVGVGRNAAVDEAKTSHIFLLDDDHVVGPRLRIGEVIKRAMATGVGILGVRQGHGGMPHLFKPSKDGKGLRVVPGAISRRRGVRFCHISSNAFLAEKRVVQQVGWDEEIKTCEHWEFFYRAQKLGVSVGVAQDCAVRHLHVGMMPYKRLRGREFYRGIGLKKHGLKTLQWAGGAVHRA